MDTIFTDRYFDIAGPEERTAVEMLSNNLRGQYGNVRGYRVEAFLGRGSLDVTATDSEAAFLVLLKGPVRGELSRAMQRKLNCFKGCFKSYSNMLGGDLVVLPPNGRVKFTSAAEAEEITVWAIFVQWNPDTVLPRSGIIPLANSQQHAGGCATDAGAQAENAFRATPYSLEITGEGAFPNGFKPPIEVHVPFIKPGTSDGHYHPPQGAISPELGAHDRRLPAQHEIYIALDHRERGLTQNEPISIRTYPNPEENTEYDARDLDVGSMVSMRAGVGHWARGLMVVIAIPAFYRTDENPRLNEIPVGQPFPRSTV